MSMSDLAMYAMTALAVFSLLESWQGLRSVRARCEQARSMPIDKTTGLLTVEAVTPMLEVEFNRARRLDHQLSLSLVRVAASHAQDMALELAHATEFPDLAFRLADDLFLITQVGGEQSSAAGTTLASANVPQDGISVAPVLEVLSQRINMEVGHAG